MNRHRRAIAAADDSAESGAALLEFALVAPLLAGLLFGVIEFGLLFGQRLDVTNGAREGARLAAVNYQASGTSSGAVQTGEIVAATCARMELAESATVSISFPGTKALGGSVVVEVRAAFTPVTGVFDPLLDQSTLSRTTTFRLEQDATYDAVTSEPCP